MTSLRAAVVHVSGIFASLIRSSFGLRYRPVAKLYFLLRMEPLRSALYEIDKRLVEIVGKRGGIFVELGANDGVAQSNSLLLEIEHGWRGILIEPIEANFNKLVKNRNGRRNRLVHAACVSDGYSGSTVEMMYLNLMSFGFGLESDLPNPDLHIEEGKKFLRHDDAARTEIVPARTLTSVLDNSNLHGLVDLLLLDVEGAELEVLKGLDLHRYRIEWILVESRNLERVSNHLAIYGYIVHSNLTSHDILFRRQT